MNNDMIFWDVDTQYDFLKPDGKLYFPEAQEIIDNISRIRKFALENGYSIIASMDWHTYDNEEISEEPDYEQTFPPHCMVGQKGAERIGYLGDIKIDYLPLTPLSENELSQITERGQFHIVIRKNTLDTFDNPNTIEVLEIVKPAEIAVFGVALDICVVDTIDNLLSWGKTKIKLIKDAVKGAGERPDEEILKELEGKGVDIVTMEELEKELL